MNLSWWIILLGTVALLLFADEVGFRYARRTRSEIADRQKGHVGAMVGAILALLGLLLGFSFSMVADRFSARRALLLEDANAISTVFLRAEMLPAPHDDRVQALLREYVDIRVKADTPEALPGALARSAELHDELWAEAVAIDELQPDHQATGLFLSALNDLIDLHEARVTVALYQRMPPPVALVLYTAAFLAMGVVGFSTGLARDRVAPATIALTLAVASLMTLIIELDRPAGSLVTINQFAMRDVAEMMAGWLPVGAPP